MSFILRIANNHFSHLAQSNMAYLVVADVILAPTMSIVFDSFDYFVWTKVMLMTIFSVVELGILSFKK